MRVATLKKNKEFARVYSRGRSYAGKRLVMIYLQRRYGGVFVGFSVSKKVGGSVVRNKVRRRAKEAYRLLYPDLCGSAQIIFVARAAAAGATYKELSGELAWLLKKAGFLPNE